MPTHFKEAKGRSLITPNPKLWRVAKPNDTVNRADWWRVFKDARLSALEKRLHQQNQTIANAEATYRQAQALIQQARAALFPTLSGSFTDDSATATVTTRTQSFNASWEPDLWGSVRRSIEENTATAESDRALLASTRLSAEGALAQDYYQLRALDRDQVLLDALVLDYQKSLQLMKNQYKAGVVSRVNVVQSENSLQTAQANAINNQVLRTQYEHAIAVLIGQNPSDFTILKNPLIETQPPAIPILIPSCWLERRPDVAQAERLMQAKNAAIGIAIATYYPNLTLTGSGSISNISNTVWSFGASLIETLYEGGSRRAEVLSAKAAYEAQVASYRQTVLAAFQNVEDSISTLRIQEKTAIKQKQAAQSARISLQLEKNQYKSGIVDYASVLTSDINLLNAEKIADDAIGQSMVSAVTLIMALGGGWHEGALCNPS